MKRLFNTIDEWKIIQDKIEFEENRLAESIMSIGNGYMGMRCIYKWKNIRFRKSRGKRFL